MSTYQKSGTLAAEFESLDYNFSIMHEPNHPIAGNSLKSRVEDFTKVEVQTCYQCGKCTAGCPLNEDMDIMPNQILRMLQSEYPGYEDEILGSLSIWLCLACETCYARCPQEVKISALMDFLRQESLRQKKVHPEAKNILRFHQSFIDEVRRNGKQNELGLTIEYKLKSFALLQDMENAPSMLLKGKLGLFPKHVRNTKEIKKLFDRIKNPIR
jgi:heterodisulfide reductase subunit C2